MKKTEENKQNEIKINIINQEQEKLSDKSLQHLVGGRVKCICIQEEHAIIAKEDGTIME